MQLMLIPDASVKTVINLWWILMGTVAVFFNVFSALTSNRQVFACPLQASEPQLAGPTFINWLKTEPHL